MIETPKTTPIDDHEELRRRLERLCRAIAPGDIGTLPLYVVFASDLPSELTGTMGGFTGPTVDQLCRPYIHSWVGHGPCYVVDDRRATQCVRRILPECDDASRWRYACGAMTATALHEFGHILQSGVRLYEPTDIDGEREALMRRVAAEKRQMSTGKPLAIDYNEHGLSFIRICCHIHWRAEQLGIRFPLPTVCGGLRYRLSCATRYAFAIRDEPQRLADWTFQQIRKTPPPEMLAAIYARDLELRERRANLPTRST